MEADLDVDRAEPGRSTAGAAPEAPCFPGSLDRGR